MGLASFLHRQIEGFSEQKKTGNKHTVHRDITVYETAKGLSWQIFHCLLVFAC